jgi:ABC-2 type transport system permease protein
MTGWGRLLRSALLRDRVLLPVWVLSIASMVAFSGSSIKELYPTKADREKFAASIEDNTALIAIRGATHGLDTLGGQVAWQLGWFAMVAAALMSLLLVVRHTRADEESGRTELLLATPLGRYAPLAAALGIAVVANLAIFVVTVVAVMSIGVPLTGTVALAASIALTGVFFAAVAAFTAQLASTSRAASGIAGGVLGVAYLVRALGDVKDSDFSLLSPIGLGQAMRPYGGDRLWPALVLLVAAGLVVAAGFALLERRDLGAGVIQPKPGPATASGALSSPLGLAVRLQRASLGWWALGLFVMGLVYGSIAQDVGDLLDTSSQVEDIFIRGSKADVVDAFLATTSLIMALIATGFMITAVLRLRSEEAAGRAEPVLATATSRFSWAGSHGLVGLVGSAGLLAVAGAGVGITYGLQGAGLEQVPRLAAVGLAQAPAVWLVGGIGLALFGVVPRLASVVGAVLGWCVVVGLMAPVLGLPGWVAEVSPYHNIPQVPAESLTALPLIAITALAAGLWLLGFVGVRRRDIV